MQSTRTHPLGALGATFVALRPHQWTKNLLLFAGILFAGQLHDPERWAQALVAFTAYCVLSSAGYLVNDVRDADRDRLHPAKRSRPVARGDVSPRRALTVAAVLAGVGLGLAASLGLASLALAALFAGGQLAYTHWLKRLYLVDALAIAGLFVTRAAAGAVAVHVGVSVWLLICTAWLALFLAFAKRRGEVLAVSADPSAGRPVLRHYSQRRLGLLVWSCAVGSCAAYAVYAAVGRESLEMVLTIPLVLFGMGRYLYLMLRRDLGEEPDRILLTDVVLLACIFCWAVAATLALAS